MYANQRGVGFYAAEGEMLQGQELLLRGGGDQHRHRCPAVYDTVAAAVEAEDFSKGEGDCVDPFWIRSLVSFQHINFAKTVLRWP